MGFRRFYQRITEGMALRDLWDQFRSEAQSSYRFYSEHVDWESLQPLTPWRKFLRLSGELAWSMLNYLSPARRVILVLALAFWILGIVRVSNYPTLSFYGGLGLLIVLALELADRVIMKRDLQIAKEIQKWLVPSEPPELEGLQIAFATRAANTVGGDFYDVIVRQPERQPQAVLIVLADVAGKSVPAALLMATFQASLRALLETGPSLEQLARSLNKSVCDRSQEGRRFTTAFLAEISLPDGVMRFVNAGHNHPFLRRADGALLRLSGGGIPFGILEETDYSVEEIAVAQGDLLVAFTDGVVEAVSTSGEEFEESRLQSLVQGAEGPARQVLEGLQASVDSFVGQARQHDDMTWMVVRVG